MDCPHCGKPILIKLKKGAEVRFENDDIVSNVYEDVKEEIIQTLSCPQCHINVVEGQGYCQKCNYCLRCDL